MGRRGLLSRGALGASAVVAGALVGGAVEHELDSRLPPTARVAPPASAPGPLGVRVVLQGPEDDRVACLTFDDGPSARWTPLVLDILADTGVTATFFLLGEAVEAQPALVRREVAAGHEIGVHNWEHTDVYGVTIDALRGSVGRTMAAIERAGAPTPRLWRPPYGRVDAPALLVAAERRLDILLWSLSTPSAAAAREVAASVRAGSIILCHDGRGQPSEGLLSALHDSLHALRAQGVRFVTGSEMVTRTSSWTAGR